MASAKSGNVAVVAQPFLAPASPGYYQDGRLRILVACDSIPLPLAVPSPLLCHFVAPGRARRWTYQSKPQCRSACGAFWNRNLVLIVALSATKYFERGSTQSCKEFSIAAQQLRITRTSAWIR